MMCSFHTTCCTCCQPSDCTPVATTTTTTTTTTLCPDPLPCDTVYLTDCIVYSGCDDDCLQVYTGDTLTQVLAPQGAYASNGGGLYFVNSNGVITGVTSCP